MNKSKEHKPPWLARTILKWFFPDYGAYTTLGDLEEVYNHIAATEGRSKARWWYRMQVLKSVLPIIKNSFYLGVDMLYNYLKTAVRNLVKYKVFSAINIAGLAVGLMCTIFIYLYVVGELSYDRFHEKSEQLYRLTTVWYEEGGGIMNKGPATPPVVAPGIASYFNNIEEYVRIKRRSAVVKSGGDLFGEHTHFTDPNFFEVFTFPLIMGSAEAVLIDENAVVLNKNTAVKYFGEDDPVGKEIQITWGEISKVFTVSGVAENPPASSTIQFDILINMNNLRLFNTDNPGSHQLTNKGDFSAHTYFTLSDASGPQFNNARFDEFTRRFFADVLDEFIRFTGTGKEGLPFTFELNNIKDVHLDTTTYDGTDPQNIYILSGIALIILFIASINFTNLSIGRSSVRFKEIGMRKVMGATRKQLVRQFWSESVLITFIAMGLGLLLAIIFIPVFNEVSGKELSISDFLNPVNISVIIGFAFIIGIIVGSYPALVMSAMKPVSIMKGMVKISGKSFFTKGLVVLQFSLSIFLIISSIILSEQIEFMLNKDLGFDTEGVVTVHLNERSPEPSHKAAERFLNEVRNYSNIISASATSSPFGGMYSASSYIYHNDEKYLIRRYNIDENFFGTMDINLLEGRNFSPEMSTDTSSLVINKTLAKELGVENPLGEEIMLFGRIPMRVIGVVEDFNFNDLRQPVSPAIMYVRPDFWYAGVVLKVRKENISETIEYLKESWKDVSADKPFTYTFMDEDLAEFYNKDKQWRAILSYSSVFAIIIACMGIFGLTTITISRRIKEIGIRKVLGAKAVQIVNMILGEFVLLIGIANLLAWPAAYLLMQNILRDYHYRIDIGYEYFVIAGAASVAVATITVLYLVLKAAFANPVDSLRTE